MRFKKIELEKTKKPYRNYSPTALTNAYKFVKEKNISVRRAAFIHGVPETMLRDRVLGNVHPDTVTVGKTPLFTQYEEACIVKHFKRMAELGYGYSRRECAEAASHYAVQLGKREQSEPLTIKWVKGFIKRWPELRVLKPRSLELARAKMASESTVKEYFKNLKDCIQRHGLSDKPHLIFNIDEKGISVEHKPPNIVASSAYCPSAVTSGRGKTVTILGGGNAAGFAIPPFFVFPGKRMQQDLLKGASPGADGTMSESGWSNGVIFRQYIENHFLKFVPNHANQKILLLLDGHKSHVSVGLSDWARIHNVVIFILPPHTSHILQPMDVSCYGLFQNIYNALCHKAIRSTYAAITRYEVCDLACKTYVKALSPENVISGFRRTGVYPLNPSSIPCEYLLPFTVHNKHSDSDNDSQATVEGGKELNIFDDREKDLKKIKSENKGKQRDTVSKIVAGKEITEDVIKQMVVHENQHKKVKKICEKVQEHKKKDTTRQKMCEKNVVEKRHVSIDDQLPGPSHINMISDNESTLSLSDEDDSDEELCCVCDRRSPEEMRKSIPLVIVKWVQCDGINNGLPCKHWVHLQFCTTVRVVRRGDIFLCPHCTKEN